MQFTIIILNADLKSFRYETVVVLLTWLIARYSALSSS